MENFTTFSSASFSFRRELWISDFVIGNILLLVSVYLLVALVYHQLKVEKPLKETFSQLALGKKYRVLSKYTCIVIGVFSVLKCASHIGVNFAELNNVFSNKSVSPSDAAEIACHVLPQGSALAICFGYYFIYTFLWLRQSIFYTHSALKVLHNNKLKSFSIFILSSYFLTALSFFIAHLILVQHGFSKTTGFCLLQIEAGILTLYVQLLISWNVLSMVMQTSLLGLFVYPLLKQSSWYKNQQGMQNHRMLLLVKKAVVLASVCLVTDIFTVIYFTLMFDANSNNPSFIYTLNLVINHLLTIPCFGVWKKLLWPWRLKCHKIFSNTSVEKTLTSSQPRT